MYLFIFRERRREGKERERNIYWLPLAHANWSATQACALDRESNQQPFGSQAGTQSTEPHQPGQKFPSFSMANVFLDYLCI